MILRIPTDYPLRGQYTQNAFDDEIAVVHYTGHVSADCIDADFEPYIGNYAVNVAFLL